MSLSGCGDAGQLDFRNATDQRVTVSTGDESAVVDGYGGVVFLDYGCTPGDVVVEFDDGTSVSLDGPVCPPSGIVIHDGYAEVVGAAG